MAGYALKSEASVGCVIARDKSRGPMTRCAISTQSSASLLSSAAQAGSSPYEMRNWCGACNGPSFQSLVCLIGGSQKIYFLAQWRLASADQKYGLLAGPDFINPGAARRGRLNKIGWNRGHEARRSLGLGISNRPEKWGMSRYASAGDRSIAALLRGYFSGTPVSRLKFFHQAPCRGIGLGNPRTATLGGSRKVC